MRIYSGKRDAFIERRRTLLVDGRYVYNCIFSLIHSLLSVLPLILMHTF
jgi:hypothetical protein